MTERNDGGPTSDSANTECSASERAVPLLADLDVRDYFAAQAMQGLLASEACGKSEGTIKQIAETAYNQADAMLEERNK